MSLRSQLFPAELEERYQFLGLLGKGGMGAVFRAQDRQLQRVVAIKRMTLSADETAFRRFQREAHSMASIHHPNVIDVYDYGVLREGPYIVMEFLEGADLGKLLGKIDPLEALLPIADALEAVHAKDLIHRDLKPANIIRTREGRSVLTDFGLAFDPGMTALTATQVAPGTLSYMSPEQLRGKAAGPASDWYAWGATLYVLYEEVHPYQADVLHALITQDITLPSLGFEALAPDSPQARVIRAALADDPAARPRTRADVDRILAGEEAVAPRHTPGGAVSSTGARALASGAFPPEAGPVPRGRLVPIAAGLGLVGLAAGVLWPEAPAPPPPVASEAPAQARPAGPFSAGYPELLRGELRAAGGRATPTHDPLDPDPAAWGRVLDELPEARRFHRWIAGGGRPEELPVQLRDELRQVDETFVDQLLPKPFYPYLYLDPVEDLASPPEEYRAWESFARAPLPSRIGGWRLLAAQAFSEAARRREDFGRELEGFADGKEPSEPFPVGLRAYTFGGNVSFKHFVDSAFRDRDHRLALAPWTREATRALRRFVYATGRALREDPPDAAALANLSKHLADRLRLLWLSSASAVDLDALVGGTAETPAARWFSGFLAGDIAWARARAGDVDEEAFARELVYLRGAAQTAAEDPASRYLAADAAGRLVARLESRGRVAQVDAAYDDLGARLLGASEARGDLGPSAWALIRVAESWQRRSGGPPRAGELTRLVTWLEERVANLDAHSQLPRIAALRARL